MGDSRIKDVSALLSSFFDDETLRRGERYSEFFGAWQGLVGPRLAAHSRIVDVDKGLLVVEAEHPGWIQLLQLRQSAIVEEVSRRFPELGLRGIAFRLAGQAPRPPAARPGEGGADSGPEPAPERGEEAGPPETTEAPEAPAGPEGPADPAFAALMASLKRTLGSRRDH